MMKNKIFVAILRFSGVGFSFIFTYLITHYFTSESFGFYVLVFTYIQIISVVSRVGLETFLFKAISQNKVLNSFNIFSIYKDAVLIILIISIIISLFLYYNAEILSIYLFRNIKSSDFFLWISFGIIPSSILFLNSELIRGLSQFNLYTFLQNTGIYLLSIVVIIFFYYLEITKVSFFNIDNKYIPVFSYITTLYFLALISFILIVRNISKVYNITKKKTKKINMLKDSYVYMFTNLSLHALSIIDIILLSYFESKTNIALYALAIKISSIFGFVWIIYNSVSMTKLAEYFSEKKIYFIQKDMIHITQQMFYISMAIFIILILFGSNILSIFGNEYKSALPLLIILSAGQLVKNSFGLSIDLMNITGLQKELFYILVFGIIFHVILGLILMSKFGLIGAAISTATSISVNSLLRYLKVRKQLNIKYIF